MPKFTFKFRATLQYRRVIEDQCQRELAKLLRHRSILLNQLRRMQETIVGSKQQLGDVLVGSVDLERVSHFARYSAQVQHRAHGIVRTVAKLDKQIESARTKLLEATRQRKAMQLLRDRHFDHWRRRQERLETAQLDEFALQNFVRRVAMEDRS